VPGVIAVEFENVRRKSGADPLDRLNIIGGEKNSRFSANVYSCISDTAYDSATAVTVKVGTRNRAWPIELREHDLDLSSL